LTACTSPNSNSHQDETPPLAPPRHSGRTHGCDQKKPTAETPEPGAPAAPTAKGTIGVSLLTLDNPFFKVIGDNIVSEGKKRGYEAVVVSGDKDVAKQSNQIKDFIVKKSARSC
jgi:hypothetical protein